MKGIFVAGVAFCLLACSGGEGESGELNLSVGLETQSGIEPIESASALAVYPGPAGGNIAFLWLGDDLPEQCFAATEINECQAELFVSLDNDILLDQSFRLGSVDSPLQGWSQRLTLALDFAQEVPLGELVELQLRLLVGDASSGTMRATVPLVEGLFNPELR